MAKGAPEGKEPAEGKKRAGGKGPAKEQAKASTSSPASCPSVLVKNVDPKTGKTALSIVHRTHSKSRHRSTRLDVALIHEELARIERELNPFIHLRGQNETFCKKPLGL